MLTEITESISVRKVPENHALHLFEAGGRGEEKTEISQCTVPQSRINHALTDFAGALRCHIPANQLCCGPHASVSCHCALPLQGTVTAGHRHAQQNGLICMSLLISPCSREAQTSSAAGIEFLLSPLLGSMSDYYGRKPLLLLAPLATVLFRGLVARSPTLFWVVVGRLATGALLGQYITTAMAALGDMFKGEAAAMGGAKGKMQAMLGLSFILASLAGGKLMARGAVCCCHCVLTVSTLTVVTVISASRTHFLLFSALLTRCCCYGDSARP